MSTQQRSYCIQCGGSGPDLHKDWCQFNPRNQNAFQAQAEQSLLYANQLAAGCSPDVYSLMGSDMEFVGGPLDGMNFVHYQANYILRDPDDQSGYYELLADGRYHWKT